VYPIKEKAMKQSTSIIKIPLWSFIFLGLWGCVPAALVVGAGAGAGTYAYIEGASQAVYPIPFDQMWEETLNLLKEQQIGVIEQSRKEGEGTIKARRADSTNVAVDLSVQGTQNTKVAIRIGLIPERTAAETLQRALARRVKVNLSR
jgi:hypothetical protein